jgi:NAD(P)H-dependent FMN reductase
MRFLICNGSPRGVKGYSEKYIHALTDGLSEHPDVLIEKVLLNRVAEHRDVAARLAAADCAIVVFPLYTDAMPGLTMAFFEEFKPFIGSLGNLSLGFVVQSGFPERIQSRAVEKYLERLTEILGARYAGTAVFGGGMGMNEKRTLLLHDLGRAFFPEKKFDPAILSRTTPMEKVPLVARVLIGVLGLTPLPQLDWIRQLKANGAYEKRDDQPYI